MIVKCQDLDDELSPIFSNDELTKNDYFSCIQFRRKHIKDERFFSDVICHLVTNLDKFFLDDDFDSFQNIITSSKIDIRSNNYGEYYLDRCAMLSSIRCFKYLLLNNCKISENIISKAIMGGSIDIINILEQEGKKVSKDDILVSISYHQKEIFHWILDQFEYDKSYLVYNCILNFDNIEIHEALQCSFSTLSNVFFDAFFDLYSDFYELDFVLCWAIETRIKELINKVIDHPNLDLKRDLVTKSPLFLASSIGDAELVQRILQVPGNKINQKIGIPVFLNNKMEFIIY